MKFRWNFCLREICCSFLTYLQTLTTAVGFPQKCTSQMTSLCLESVIRNMLWMWKYGTPTLVFSCLSIDTFPEKLMMKNMEQQQTIQYFTSIPFTPEITIATRGDGWLSSADMNKTKRRRRRKRGVRKAKNWMRGYRSACIFQNSRLSSDAVVYLLK